MADLLACPVCNARVAPGAARCVVCRSSLTGLARPATVAMTPPVYAQPSVSSSDDDEDDDDRATADDTTHQRERFEPGLKIRNRYLLRRALGEGVLGAAWEARDQHHGAEVVLKVVADMLVTNERERIDLVGKLEMFAGRSLPGVVMPREVFAVPGAVVVVYPRVEAASLRAVIDARRARGERFSPEECLRVVQSLVAAIQAMHTASPHGALWPQNVLLTARGALLVDGFLAVSVAPERLAARIGHHPRSSPFAAPELLAARRPTASADLYALGAIVADLAGGAPPGEGPDLASISRELHRAAASLLDREPGRRPAGVRALLDALTLAAGLAQRPADPSPPSPDDVLAHGALPSPLDDRPPLDPPTLPAPESPRAMARPKPVAPAPVAPAPAPVSVRPPPSSRPPAPMVTQRPAPPPADPLGAPPGRLRGPTATIPANAPRASNGVTSGPPPSMSVKSGPPSAQRPPAPIAPTPAPPPAASVAPVAASPAPASPEARAVPRTLPSINDAMLAAHPQRAPMSPSRLPMPPRPPPASPPVPSRPSVSARPPPAPPVPSRPSPPIATSRPPMPPSPSRLPVPPSPARLPLPSGPSRPPAPMVSSPPPRRAPAPVERSMSDDDGIDPKLLRAAQMLDDERRRDR